MFRQHWRAMSMAALLLFVAGLAAPWLGSLWPRDGGENPGEETRPIGVPRPCHFALATNYRVGRQPYTLAAADFNADGKLDLVVSNIRGNTVSVLLGAGDGSFRPAVDYAVGRGPHGVAVADFNGDGFPDVVVCNLEDDTVSILIGNGDGSFRATRACRTGKGPRGIAVADIDGDGKLDLVVTNSGAHTVSVYLGNGDGTFRNARGEGAVVMAEVAVPISVAVADCNGDGRPDLVVSCASGNYVAVALGKGDGTFHPPRTYGVGSGPGAIVVADFNGDGKIDIAVENFATDDVSVLLGNGDGTFQTAVSYPAGSRPGGLAVGDFNGDGVPDLAVVNHHSRDVSILLGKGDGTFASGQAHTVGRMPAGAAVGDFNGDGRLDVAVVNHFADDVSVLLNQPPAPHFRLSANRDMLAGILYSVSLTPLDAWNATDPDYTGTIELSSSDPKAEFPARLSLPADPRGALRFPVTFRTAGAQTLTAVNVENRAHHGRISVLCAPQKAASLRVSAPPEVVAGKPCPVTVTPVDGLGNTDTEYAGAVRLSSDAEDAAAPVDHTFAAADGGAHTFTIAFPSAGTWTVSARDISRPALTGSVQVKVTPAAMKPG
jgi:hypothetical protein